MSATNNSLLIGVDGGGTRCRFGLSVAQTRYEWVGSAANASTDLNGTITTLTAGFAELAKQAGMTLSDLAHARAYIGLAGALGAQQIDPIASALPVRVVRIEDDRRAAAVGALGDDDGIVAGIGTGSFLAHQTASRIRFLGGWGAQLGDEASGAWLGRRALTCVLHVADGLEDASSLTNALLNRFEKDTTNIVSFAATATPQAMAELAPLVADAADAGDMQGKALILAGADYVTRACRASDWSAGTPLCLIGGLAPRYAPYLPADLAAHLADPKGRALDGALALAARIGAP